MDPIAWLGEGDGFKSFTRQKSVAARWAKSNIFVIPVYAPDERAAEVWDEVREVMARELKFDWDSNQDGAIRQRYVDHTQREFLDQLYGAVARALAAAPKAQLVQGWQTMDSAPKDGTEILVCGPDIYGGVYREVQRWPLNWGLKWPVTYMAYAAGEPTHWMHLPEGVKVDDQRLCADNGEVPGEPKHQI